MNNFLKLTALYLIAIGIGANAYFTMKNYEVNNVFLMLAFQEQGLVGDVQPQTYRLKKGEFWL